VRHPITNRDTSVLPVCPLSLRPAPRFATDVYSAQHATTAAYGAIVRANLNARKLHTDEAYARLRDAVRELLDVRVRNKSRPPFLSRFRGKQGRLRRNLLGKRVNLSARSVIVGDPALKHTEVGIPRTIADTLLVQRRVTDINRRHLFRLFEEDQRNCREHLWEGIDEKQIARGTIGDIGDVIHRPMRDGDTVILNRQPTLHKLSMLAFDVRVVPYSTIRIPPVVTKGFNADFDGDEMNIFAVSSPEARAEIECLMHIRHHPEAVRFIHDSKLEAHLEGAVVDATDDRRRHMLLNNLRLRGFSVGWDDIREPRHETPTCSTTDNVHSVKNIAMKRVKDMEPRDSPWRSMIEAKSKGNWANLCAIKATLGQQFVRGDTPERLFAWEPETRRNRGFVFSSYRKGLTAKEFFFHCMAGREGLIDTAVRTADAGYTHRKIARFLEDVRKCHDGTVRDEYMNIIAFPGAPSALFDHPGCFIGINAAQSIGEPATQLTLNTFHSSGAINEITTSGLKRLNEILRWTKTPSVLLSTLDDAFAGSRASWVLRETTLRTFCPTIHGTTHEPPEIPLDKDALLIYDTDARHIARSVPGARVGPRGDTLVFEEALAADTLRRVITGVKGIKAVNAGVALHTANLPKTLYGTKGHPHCAAKVNEWLGIEAARTVFINELQKVLPQVKLCYLELLADGVTYEGKTNPLQHSSFATKHTLKAACFERAQMMFPRAAKENRNEQIIGLSERIIFDQLRELPMTVAV